MSCSARPTAWRASRVWAGSPNTSTSPEVTRMRLHTALIRVVLPAPFGPRRPKNAPAGTVRSKFSTARVPSSYRLVRPRSSRAGASSRNTAPRLAPPGSRPQAHVHVVVVVAQHLHPLARAADPRVGTHEH